MRPYEIATAAVLIGIAAVAMFDSRNGAFIAEGGAAGGIRAGFFPFWASFLIVAGAVAVIFGALRTREAGKAPFSGREGVTSVVKLILPMVAAVTLMIWLGFYIVTALYLGFFMRYVGSYRWPWVIGTALAMPTAIFFVFERFFRVPLEKSDFYTRGILPF
ncbi:MAG: tripartite tricarboxylate transporter TctB family protein [Candidatus Limnocylindria bacterium]